MIATIELFLWGALFFVIGKVVQEKIPTLPHIAFECGIAGTVAILAGIYSILFGDTPLMDLLR